MARKKSPTLTDAELRLMEILWEKGEATVNDVVVALPRHDPKPPTGHPRPEGAAALGQSGAPDRGGPRVSKSGCVIHHPSTFLEASGRQPGGLPAGPAD